MANFKILSVSICSRALTAPRRCASGAVVALLFVLIFALPSSASAQRLLQPAEGSRPGQTYIKGQPPTSAATPEPVQAVPVDPAYPAGSSALLPPPNAGPVTPRSQRNLVIMEFSDLQCPDSARYNVGLKTTILQRYVRSGQVDYQWHDFPLPSHDQAITAAAAARCGGPAAEDVRRRIMANQGAMTPMAYVQYARESGVNSGQFETCMRSNQHQQAVMADKALGQSYGVRGTPTLVLGVKEGQGRIRPVKVVKAYDPPQQVLAQIDEFITSAGARAVHN